MTGYKPGPLVSKGISVQQRLFLILLEPNFNYAAINGKVLTSNLNYLLPIHLGTIRSGAEDVYKF